MKKYFFIILIFFISCSSYAKDGVYYLDVNLLLNNSNNGKKIINKLKKINDENILKIKSYENDLKENFRSTIRSYINLYGYVSQIIEFKVKR